MQGLLCTTNGSELRQSHCLLLVQHNQSIQQLTMSISLSGRLPGGQAQILVNSGQHSRQECKTLEKDAVVTSLQGWTGSVPNQFAEKLRRCSEDWLCPAAQLFASLFWVSRNSHNGGTSVYIQIQSPIQECEDAISEVNHNTEMSTIHRCGSASDSHPHTPKG